MIRTLLLALAIATTLAAPTAASAGQFCRGEPHARYGCIPNPGPLPPHVGTLVRMELVDRDQGRTLPNYRHRGQQWVPGTPGDRYAVRLTNTTGQRVLVVLSVDGVNAVTGQTAAPTQAGYVLGPWETAEINGWRKSLDDVAQFVFTDLPDSYAARTGRPDNVGVVGIAVFRERRYLPPPPIARALGGSRLRQEAPAPSARAAESMARDAVPQQLGTGHGDREWSPVGQTAFERASPYPAQVTQLRYDSMEALVAMGIVPRWRDRYASTGPRAFPGGFVPDPPRW